MTDLDAEKKQLRKQAAAQRKIAFDAMPDAPQKIAQFHDIIHSLYAPKSVAAYWPIRTEIDPIPLMTALCEKGGYWLSACHTRRRQATCLSSLADWRASCRWSL